MTGPIRWGILGAGRIADRFARDLTLVDDARLSAVGSRDAGRAAAFAERFAIPHRHASYEALVADPDVDVVYVATPHPQHLAACLLAIDAGKAVLCEKPLTVNAAEAATLIARARARRVFVMEAMWTRFFPAVARLRELLADGAIGEVRALQAAFGFRAPNDPGDRLLNPTLAGGALLDVGVYPVSLASLLLGEPEAMAAVAMLGPTGVDEQTALSLRYPGGAIASLACAVRTEMPRDAVILGTRGHIRLGPPFWRPTRIEIHRTADPAARSSDRSAAHAGALERAARAIDARLATLGPLGARIDSAVRPLARRLLRGGRVAVERFPLVGHGFHYQQREVGRCLRAGLLESPTMPLDESLAILRTIDRARQQIGLRYPMEPDTGTCILESPKPAGLPRRSAWPA